ncbi:MAG: phosphoenolpyruvate synthase [Desulfuromonas sp.]|nr:MAG: phosphoenolpyruvate synthase [Desulfuromonas sp.]
MQSTERISTGYSGLDEILDSLRLGDNVVLKVDSIDDYRYFVGPFVDQALLTGKKVVYMRFGDHPPLIEPSPHITTYTFDPRQGFESFASRIHKVITEEGRGVFYVFDSLSELLSAWATDHMIGNFFRVTCPYLFELDTVAYFALIRKHHAVRTIERIRETTQVLIDIFKHDGMLHVHPLKVWQRNSPTMFLPHRKQGEQFIPLANSFEATQLLAAVSTHQQDSTSRQLDHWHRLFLQAEQLYEESATDLEQAHMVKHICRHMIGREERILSLSIKHFSLRNLLDIKSRVIGTGFIGGKALGMLLAQNILRHDTSLDWENHLEAHDSFFVGSNVYYSYIVHNGLWRLFMQQKTPEGYFTAASELRKEMLLGSFPDPIREGFHKMLDYYGQYPIIIRSSSLLEDGFGNAFAGKYESVFCVNQGSPEERLEQLEEAIRKVFASAMSEDALTYRLQRGLDQQDEQMALLVKRVSGSYRQHYYFPELAGVGVSYNTFVWDKNMNPRAGMLRLVLGLGTRAVDRTEGDYPRIVALDAPLKRPHQGFEDTRKFSQRDVDLLNINENCMQTVSLLALTDQKIEIPWRNYAVQDRETMQLLERRGQKKDIWLLTFDQLFADTQFQSLMQRMLKVLEDAYEYPVDVEFTVNFTSDGVPKINVVQCRPLQTKGTETEVVIPRDIAEEQTFFRTEGNFMGGNISQPLKWVIWVEPAEYSRLPVAEKHEIARLVGRLNKRIADKKDSPTMLLGPGRWGTSTPAMGVPITFSEINNLTALAEVAFTSGNLMPELSFGSHFFQDLVEAEIFYLALFPEHKECVLNTDWLQKQPNSLEGLLPTSARYKKVVKVFRVPEKNLQLMADVVSQQLICFLQT